MIQNDDEHQSTLRQRELLARGLDRLVRDDKMPAGAGGEFDPHDQDAYVLELQRASIEGQLAALNADLSDYERRGDQT
ncbi:hypothetical protein [Actinomadura sp. DC4]|uniref:hypothetical protein n=1 Tax=Actinomadura sp. DC4 TaxID=3055069 RepID=UPI0025AFDCDC|nr:hypothetical protein [Actinomadura sp. DC4]MDN3353074.1 hypothetical protein [Actinomadura sp. DC4]